MRQAALAALALTACVSGAGQKVTVLLTDRTVQCVAQDEGPKIGVLVLDQPEDFYLAEFRSQSTGLVRTLEGSRDDKEVTFVCPQGVSDFVVRHATVLQARREDPTSTPAAPTVADSDE